MLSQLQVDLPTITDLPILTMASLPSFHLAPMQLVLLEVEMAMVGTIR